MPPLILLTMLVLLAACREHPAEHLSQGSDAAGSSTGGKPSETAADASQPSPTSTSPVASQSASASSSSTPDPWTTQPTPGEIPTAPLPKPPEHPFVVNPNFPDCVHPGVKAECNDGWCRIPAGCYVYGSPEDEFYRARYDEQQVRVTLTHDFEIQQTEVTVEEWTGAGLAHPNVAIRKPGEEQLTPPCMDPRCPVNSTTLFEALRFANSLSVQRALAPCFRIDNCALRTDVCGEACHGYGEYCSVELLAPSIYECEGYRLPTSAEWEYAARAGTTTTFYSGPITVFEAAYPCYWEPSLARTEWFCANYPTFQEQRVGQLPSNPWGLNDMLGNVSEWVMDGYHGLALSDPQIDPGGLLEVEESTTYRGGAFYSEHITCRVARKGSQSPDYRLPGFRLARTLGKGTLPTLADVPSSP